MPGTGVYARLVVVLVLIGASCLEAAAQAKTDVVTLQNGDRITGEVKELNRGRLEFSTDDAGTIYVEWDNILALQASRQFDVYLADGRRFLGRLARDADRSILVVTADSSVALRMAQVTAILPIGASFWKQLDGSIDSGFSYTRSSAIAQFTLNALVTFHRPAFEARLDGSLTLTGQEDGEERDDRGAITAGYSRYRGTRWTFGGQFGFETNESLGLSVRSQLAGGVGWRAVSSNRALLEFGAGLAFNDEQYLDSGATQNIEVQMGFRGSYFTYDRPKTTIDVSLVYYPSLTTSGRQRLQFDASVKHELLADFFVGLDAYDSFDSKPPSTSVFRNDFGLTATIGWSF